MLVRVLLVRRLERPDWAWVQAWFADEVLDRELGPLDTDWLDHVLADVLADPAVDPARRRTGVGAEALTAVTAWPGHPPAEGWIAFVDPDNAPAFAFFAALGWAHEGLDDAMHRFRR
ncbi:GNAT family N-acetyltransferase [Pimelobacter sp. 30-1]|uniref:GNAT family N-acetyltransferase n=1 Tax=Pimelobacter sp. 30-1 TaxID=2004991 RepID=UPI001C04602A|nr:GNAT family N-acetyltransferase [Pimelobacter sp. 30-1]MBU2694430.1 hypothetical protein [Pimelobacter sp. 30-1]